MPRVPKKRKTSERVKRGTKRTTRRVAKRKVSAVAKRTVSRKKTEKKVTKGKGKEITVKRKGTAGHKEVIGRKVSRDESLEELISRGQDKGFVTDIEILDY